MKKRMNHPKVSYDPDAKILSIKLSSARSVDSDIKGNVVLDYDVNGNMVNVDIMSVSISEFGHTPTLRALIGLPRMAKATS